MIKRNKKILAIISSVLFVGMLTGCTSGIKTSTFDGKGNVVEFKGGEVTKAQLYDEMVQVAGFKVALNMVDEGILNGIYPENEEIKAKVEDQVSKLKTYYGDSFIDVLRSNGINSEEEYREVLLLGIQREDYVREYIKNNEVSEEEIQAAYDAFEPKIKASHILVKPKDASDMSLELAKGLAESIVKKLETGADFAELAKEFSEDKGSGANGGDLGYFGKGDMVPEFEAAAYDLKVGEYTKEPVKSQFGYHVILKTDEQSKGTLEEMKDDLIASIVETKIQSDSQIGEIALIKMRKDHGIKFKDETIKKQYEEFVKSFEKQEEPEKVEDDTQVEVNKEEK